MTVGVQFASIKYYGKICTLMQILLNTEKAPKISTPVGNEWLSCKILQDSGKILQDGTSSCKIFFQNLARSCKITLCLARILQDNHSSCKYANKWNMIEQDQNETRTLLPINFFTL